MNEREKLIEVMAVSDAAFDGRPWSSMGRVERERYQSRSAAALAAMEAAGYDVVPREPTFAMVRAGDTAPDDAEDIYRAMLAASPIRATADQQEAGQ